MIKTLLLLASILSVLVQAGGPYESWGKYEKQLPAPLIVPEFSNGRPICPCYIPNFPTAALVTVSPVV
jgi:hypothetical protein